MTAIPATGLAERLKLGTRDLHTQAEQAGVMGELLRGRIDRAAYSALLRNLFAVYEALEGAIGLHASEAWVQALWDPALRRTDRLAEDLDTLRGGDWRQEIALENATGRYVERLRALGKDGSVALVAHVYVRSLGDLHGGQILSRIVRERFGLATEAGTRFYAFGGTTHVLALRAAFRSGLESLSLDESEVQEIVTEARGAFALHRELFDQLASRHSTASAANA